jgi:hypothetical protein
MKPFVPELRFCGRPFSGTWRPVDWYTLTYFCRDLLSPLSEQLRPQRRQIYNAIQGIKHCKAVKQILSFTQNQIRIEQEVDTVANWTPQMLLHEPFCHTRHSPKLITAVCFFIRIQPMSPDAQWHECSILLLKILEFIFNFYKNGLRSQVNRRREQKLVKFQMKPENRKRNETCSR